MFNFSKLPNKLFYNKDGDSILKSVNNDYKVLIILDYLYYHVDRLDFINFTLEDIIIKCRFIPKTGKGKTNTQFQYILSKLQDLHIITLLSKNKDLKSIKPKDLIICKFDNYLESFVDKEGNPYETQFFELYDDEKYKILTYKEDNIDNIKLLIYYCYLKCRMYKRRKEDYQLEVSGGRAETCNLSYQLINKDLNIVDKSIKKYNDILVELNLIRIGYPGNWYYKDDTIKMLKDGCNIYSLWRGSEEATKNNLEEGIKWYKKLDINKNKVFTGNRQYKNNDKSINGKYGRIVRKENEGKATPEDLVLKEKILNAKNPNYEMQKLIGILDANVGERLYNLHGDKYWDEDKAEYYADIENKLGLDDDNDKLRVDWGYYKWVMINYHFGEHKNDIEYYKNCINKKLNDIGNKNKPKELVKKSEIKENKVCNQVSNSIPEDDRDEDVTDKDVTEAINNAITDEESNDEDIAGIDEALAKLDSSNDDKDYYQKMEKEYDEKYRKKKIMSEKIANVNGKKAKITTIKDDFDYDIFIPYKDHKKLQEQKEKHNNDRTNELNHKIFPDMPLNPIVPDDGLDF